VPVAIALALVATIWLRYEGPWAENDTVVLTGASRAILDEGTISPDRDAYTNGFAYPTLLASLASVTGLSIRLLQVGVLPWLTVATALMAFVAFRAITGSGRVGAVAASLLLVQPDFLFVNQRGSHEKMTWTLVLALLFALMASLEGRRLGLVAPYIGAFYVCGFALNCTNAFFGSSFTTIVLLALLGSTIVARRFFRVYRDARLLPRLGYIFLVLSALAYVIVFYAYPPATGNLANLGRVVDRLATLYLNVDTRVETKVTTATQVAANADVSQARTGTSPYAYVSLGWTSPHVFFLLTVFTWLLLIAAVLSWLAIGVTFVRRGVARRDVPLFLVWAFAVAAAAQIALSVVSDYAGALGSNLQLRLFPVFTVFAIPLVVSVALSSSLPRRSKLLRWAAIVIGLTAFPTVAVAFPVVTVVVLPGILVGLYIVISWNRSARARRLAAAIGVVAFAYFAGAAVLKATNDPLVSNQWTFYTDAEAHGLRWGNVHLDKLFVWADFDERLSAASKLVLPDNGPGAMREASWARSRASTVRYVFLSDVIADRATRTDGVLPDTRDDDRIYDNGSVQIAHLVPDTPYQP
jgi:hypothetical protein